MNRRKGAVRLVLVYSFLRHLISSEYGVFDRCVEIGVLLFVGYEVVVAFLERRKTKQRGKEIVLRLEAIRKFIRGGHGLLHDAHAFVEQRTLPHFLTSADWIDMVWKWNAEIQRLLTDSYPPQTLEAYMYDSGTRDRSYPELPPAIWPQYSHLQLRLKNLQNIMEKPEVYL